MSTAKDRRDTIDAPTPGGGLRGLIERALRARDLNLRVCSPGTVVTYDPATQIAQVTLGFLTISSQDTPAGELEVPLPPDLVFARVALVQGATHSDHVPIAPGDTGLLLFADRSLDAWYRGPGTPVDPEDGRTHDLADAVFVPGLSPDSARAAPPANPLARTIDAPVIALGSAATDFVLQGTAINAALVAPRSTLSGTPVSASLDPATVTAVAANKTAILAIIDALAANTSIKVQVE